MDTETEILGLGILVGFLITMASMATVALIGGFSEMIILSMIIISAGVIGGMFLIAELINFLMNFKIVRRD